MGIEFLAGLAIAGIFFAFTSLKIVDERTARIVQRLGRFNRVLEPGMHFVMPILEQSSSKIDLRIQQIDVHIETKTKDNVFVKLQVSVHLEIIKERIQDAYYRLSDPYAQISSYIFDDVRAEVPKMTLDDVFARKEDIALAVQENLAEHMQSYGYRIIKALITDIEPDALVKESMNRINAARRNKEALAEDAEGRKMAKIKDAEAEKESKRLQGEGVAEQRLAIIKGFADSVQDFSQTLDNVSPHEIMQFVLLTQHYDTIKEIGEKNSSLIVPYSPGAVQDIQQQIMQGSFMGNKLNELNDPSKKATIHSNSKIPLQDQIRETFEQREKSILDINKNVDEAFSNDIP